MITKVFCIYDSKAKVFQLPFFMPTIGAAVRAFEDLVMDKSTMVNRHPDDFVLYEIGQYDDSNAETIAHHPISLVVTAKELKKDDLLPLKLLPRSQEDQS